MDINPNEHMESQQSLVEQLPDQKSSHSEIDSKSSISREIDPNQNAQPIDQQTNQAQSQKQMPSLPSLDPEKQTIDFDQFNLNL
jgi:hypothetical protein